MGGGRTWNGTRRARAAGVAAVAVAAGCLVMSDVLAVAQDYFRALYAPDHDRVREVASPAMTFADPTAEGQAAPPSLMNSFINEVNRYWETTDVLSLASYCLWRLNHSIRLAGSRW